MKNVLIVIDNLYTGGVATSLYNYLSNMNSSAKYELLVFDEKSVDLSRIPKNIKLLPPAKLLHILGKKQNDVLKESKLLAAIRGCLVLASRMFGGEFARKILFCFIPFLGCYDVAISFSQDDGWNSISKGCNDYVLSKVKAQKKICYIHCDYKNFGGYNVKQRKQYDGFDRIVCVSESCKQSFSQCFPSLEKKVYVCENFVNIERIQKLALPKHVYNDKVVNFVTVCRLGDEKGLIRAANAFKRVYDNGFDGFHWTIVGEGPERESLEDFIKVNDLGKYITLIGNKDNPYPYIAGASMFLLPSFHEAAPMVFNESAALNIPVLTTNTCSAIELVEERKIGIVTENSEDGLFSAISDACCGRVDMSAFKFDVSRINIIAKQQVNIVLSY